MTIKVHYDTDYYDRHQFPKGKVLKGIQDGLTNIITPLIEHIQYNNPIPGAILQSINYCSGPNETFILSFLFYLDNYTEDTYQEAHNAMHTLRDYTEDQLLDETPLKSNLVITRDNAIIHIITNH